MKAKALGTACHRRKSEHEETVHNNETTKTVERKTAYKDSIQGGYKITISGQHTKTVDSIQHSRKTVYKQSIQIQ